MKQEGNLCVALVGTGSIGQQHLKVLKQMPGVRPVVIPARSARIHELEEAGYATARDVVEAVRVGATHCIVATDTHRHVEDGLAAIEAGLDLLVEKPLAVDAAQALRLHQQGRQAGRKLFVGCVLRFSESLGTFLDLSKQVGRLHSVRIECQSYLPNWRPERSHRESYSARPDEGGVLRDLIHEIDYAGWLFGWPASLQAKVRNLGRLGIGAEESADLLWETGEGCVISMGLDYLSRPSRRSMRACGELGTIEWDGINGTVTLAVAGEDPKVFSSLQTRDEMLLAQDLAFLEASPPHPPSRLATSEEGMTALAVCDAARRASESRREERVEYACGH